MRCTLNLDLVSLYTTTSQCIGLRPVWILSLVGVLVRLIDDLYIGSAYEPITEVPDIPSISSGAKSVFGTFPDF